jgi:hypothetical protein
MHTISAKVKAKIQRRGCVLRGMFDELGEYDTCEHRRLSPMFDEHQPSGPMPVASIAIP